MGHDPKEGQTTLMFRRGTSGQKNRERGERSYSSIRSRKERGWRLQKGIKTLRMASCSNFIREKLFGKGEKVPKGQPEEGDEGCRRDYK